MKRSTIIISVVCYLVFVAMWLVIGFAGIVFCMFDLNNIIPLAGKVIFIVLAMILIISPIFIKTPHPKRSYIAILLAISFAVVSSGTYFCFKGYYSYFNSKKWHLNPNKRYLMIDSFERQYNIYEMNENEIKNLLGDPDDIVHRNDDSSEQIYSYFAGDAFLDPYVYNVVFINGIVTHTSNYES